MRLYCVTMIAGLVASTSASASSFVTLGAPEEAASPSFVYLGGAEPTLAEAARPEAAIVDTALQYPSPLGGDLAVVKPAEPVELPAPRIALHYPAPMPDALRSPGGSAPITRVSQSVIAMGEPDIEYFKVAAIDAAKKLPPRYTLSPMVIRGGISGDAFASGGRAPAAVPAPARQASPPVRASARTEEKPAPKPEAPPAPPKGLRPLDGVL